MRMARDTDRSIPDSVALILAALLLSLSSLAGFTSAAASDHEEWSPWFALAREVARAEAAALAGVPPEEAEIDGETLRTGFDDEPIALFKVAAGESVREMAVDAFGATVDLEELREHDVARALAGDRTVDAELEQAALADPSAVFSILVWLREPAYVPFEMPEEVPGSSTELDLAAFEELDAELRAHVAAHNGPTVTAALGELAALGLVAGGSAYAPLVWTEATGEQVLEIGGWSSVVRVEADEEMELTLATARQATLGDVVHARTHDGHAIEGRHRHVAIVEPGIPWIYHPAFAWTSNPIRTIPQGNGDCLWPRPHATQVMGTILSVDATDRGLAPAAWAAAGASCSLKTSDLIATAEKVVDASHLVLNFSWGSRFAAGHLKVQDRYADLLTVRLLRNVVASSGNTGNSWWESEQFVYSPASSYNTVAVGAFDDRGTAQRGDDVVADFSGWRNPISRRGDRVKPNLLAPGVDIRTTDINSPHWWRVSSGTSLSAPMVAAGMSLVLQRDYTLYFAPEAMRALLMASATHNLEGGPWSTKDGAGGLDLASADDVAARQGGDWGRFHWQCGPFAEKVLDEMDLRAGLLFRAAIAWSADPSWPQNLMYDLEPGADLDLYLTDLSGTPVARSTTWDNTHEIIEFRPPADMTLRLVVKRPGCTVDPGRVGWAWFHDI